MKLFDSEWQHYAQNTDAAAEMATSELGAHDQPANIAELAAWTVVANVLLNLDETINN